jgi:hypothetical protein
MLDRLQATLWRCRHSNQPATVVALASMRCVVRADHVAHRPTRDGMVRSGMRIAFEPKEANGAFRRRRALATPRAASTK